MRQAHPNPHADDRFARQLDKWLIPIEGVGVLGRRDTDDGNHRGCGGAGGVDEDDRGRVGWVDAAAGGPTPGTWTQGVITRRSAA